MEASWKRTAPSVARDTLAKRERQAMAAVMALADAHDAFSVSFDISAKRVKALVYRHPALPHLTASSNQSRHISSVTSSSPATVKVSANATSVPGCDESRSERAVSAVPEHVPESTQQWTTVVRRKQPPARAKQVDKNALSARSGSQKTMAAQPVVQRKLQLGHKPSETTAAASRRCAPAPMVSLVSAVSPSKSSDEEFSDAVDTQMEESPSGSPSKRTRSDASDDGASDDGEVDVPAKLAAQAASWAAEGWTADEILRGCRTEPEGHTARLQYCAKPWAPKPSEQRRIMHAALVSRA